MFNPTATVKNKLIYVCIHNDIGNSIREIIENNKEDILSNFAKATKIWMVL